jgi:outer membrane receptor protein involved in Fe transport
VRSDQTSLDNAQVGYRFSTRYRLVLDAYNLFDARASDIDYFFESRLRDEPGPVEDVHFHAAIPRSFRMHLQMSF